MLTRLVAGAWPEVRRKKSIAFRTIVQLRPYRKKGRRAAGGDKRLMKLAVRNVPLRVAKRVFGVALLNAAQPMQRRNDGNFPIVIALINRACNQFHFDENARIRYF